MKRINYQYILILSIVCTSLGFIFKINADKEVGDVLLGIGTICWVVMFYVLFFRFLGRNTKH